MEIKCVNASESILAINKALWRLTSKKIIVFLIFLFTVGLSLSVYGALHSTGYSKGSSVYSESNVQILSINNYSNRHIAESIGLVLLLLVFIMSRCYILLKKSFFLKSNNIAQRFLDTDNEYTICINEKFVEHKSFDHYMKINWIKFSNYKIYKDYIFIGFENYMESITIDKRLLTQTDLDILFSILKSNDIKQIKVKLVF